MRLFDVQSAAVMSQGCKSDLTCVSLNKICNYLHFYQSLRPIDYSMFNEENYPSIVDDFQHIFLNHIFINTEWGLSECVTNYLSVCQKVKKYITECNKKECTELCQEWETLDLLIRQRLDLHGTFIINNTQRQKRQKKNKNKFYVNHITLMHYIFNHLNKCSKHCIGYTLVKIYDSCMAISTFDRTKIQYGENKNGNKKRGILIVIGYTKQTWKTYKMAMWFPSNGVTRLILFYLDISDIFDKTYCCKCITIDEKTIEYNQNYYICSQTIHRNTKFKENKWYHIFGSDTIRKGNRKIWKFKIVSSLNCGSNIIGIIKSNRKNINIGASGGDFTDYTYGFGLCTDNGTVYHNENQIKIDSALKCGCINDIIIMELNMESFENYATLKYKINNNKSVIVCTEIDIEAGWQLAVALHDNSEIALIPNTDEYNHNNGHTYKKRKRRGKNPKGSRKKKKKRKKKKMHKKYNC